MAPNIPAVQPPTMGVLCHFFEEAAALVTGAAGAAFAGRAAVLTPAGTARARPRQHLLKGAQYQLLIG